MAWLEFGTAAQESRFQTAGRTQEEQQQRRRVAHLRGRRRLRANPAGGRSQALRRDTQPVQTFRISAVARSGII